MSPPTFGGAVGVHRRLFFLRMRRRSSLWIALGLCALPPLLALSMSLFRGAGRNTFTEVMEFTLVLLPFLPLLFASSLVGDELERRTADFVLARPVPRATFLIGRLLALWPVAAALAVDVVLAFVAAFAAVPSDAVAALPVLGVALLATLLGFCAYTGLAALFSTLFPRLTIVAFGGYIVAVELGIGGAPLALHWVSLLWHLRNLAGVPKAVALGWGPTVPIFISAFLLLAAALAATATAIWRLGNAEHRGDG